MAMIVLKLIRVMDALMVIISIFAKACFFFLLLLLFFNQYKDPFGLLLFWGFQVAHGKEFTCQCRSHKRYRFDHCIRKIPWSRKWQPTSIFLPGKFHEQKSLVDYSPWDRKESDMTEQQA